MAYFCPFCLRRSNTSARYSPYASAGRPTVCKTRRCSYTPASGAVFLTQGEKDLRRELEQESSYIFSATVATQGVEIPTGITPTRDYAAQIQTQGQKHGCHSCGVKAATDADQPWIGDHVPSTGLSASMQDDIRSTKKITGGKTYLFPHCHRCSREQAQVVKRNKGHAKLSDVPVADRKYLVGTKAVSAAQCIETSSEQVSSAQGLEIQRLGVAKGCHCCGTRFPAPDYHADHVFPKEFCTNYMEQIFEKMGLPYPTKFYLMPQCVKCSSNQGGTLSHLARRARAAAGKLGIIVYK